MLLKIVYVLMGLGSLGNGVFMFFAPETWFERGYPGVTDTGPMNIHFIRDIGVVYAIVGSGLPRPSNTLTTVRLPCSGRPHEMPEDLKSPPAPERKNARPGRARLRIGMAPRARLELATRWLTASCSTN